MKVLKVGDKAPNFSCLDQNGNLINLSDLIGKKVVIFFYPKANTPGCTAEACNLNDNYNRFISLGYEIIGVSADNEKSQKKFSDKFGFNYSLLCDENKDLINAYGVWGLKKFMGKEYMGIIRKTFTIDEEGKISQIIDKVKTKEHTSQILD
ncbi:MAG: thioredoxin-dependent thiol peroxidase [Flavobacteriaceae bacterium]|tara:strand:+ start:708 stop:1160 length:453 start_codon:yes stop_codon:yes gene_type:complete